MSRLPDIQGKLGFGTLRLPVKDGKVNIPELCEMVDIYMQNGFNYFDLAHAYMSGQCEESMRKALVDRYPREDFVLCNKLTWEYFKNEEDIIPFFESQLKLCGTSFFDIYLLHALTRYKFEKFKKCNAFEVLKKLKKDGKIKHIGISFHDKSDFLKELLDTYPEIEIVQIQFNYADYKSSVIESKKLYDICLKYNKPTLAMESVKGGSLAALPDDAKSIFDALNEKQKTDYSAASYALRFVAGFENIKVVLSGMSNTAQIKDNVAVFKNFLPLNDNEKKAIKNVTDIFNSKNLIQCTACRYCIDGCPKHILIPDMFACYNQKKVFNTWNQGYYYRNVLTSKNGKASECIKCGICEKACPQSLKIRDLLTDVADEFEFKSIAKWVKGQLLFYNKGKPDKAYTGLAQTEKGNTVYFKEGIFQKDYSGAVKFGNKEYLIINGVLKKQTGAYWIGKVLTFFKDGVKDLSYTGMAFTSKGNMVLMTKGTFDKNYTGLISDEDGKIIFVKNGVFDKKFTGRYKGNDIEKGILHKSFSRISK